MPDTLLQAISNASIISHVSTLVPFAKNRSRVPSIVSGVTADTLRKSRTFSGEITAALSPWDPDDFSDGCLVVKILSIIIAPAYLFGKWTCPVVHYNRLEHCWSKPLAVLQAVFIPVLFYVLFKQYEAEDFAGPGMIDVGFNLK